MEESATGKALVRAPTGVKLKFVIGSAIVAFLSSLGGPLRDSKHLAATVPTQFAGYIGNPETRKRNRYLIFFEAPEDVVLGGGILLGGKYYQTWPIRTPKY